MQPAFPRNIFKHTVLLENGASFVGANRISATFYQRRLKASHGFEAFRHGGFSHCSMEKFRSMPMRPRPLRAHRQQEFPPQRHKKYAKRPKAEKNRRCPPL